MIDARQRRINQYEELKIMPLDRFGLPKRRFTEKTIMKEQPGSEQ